MTVTRFAPGSGTAYVTESVIALSGASTVDPDIITLCATNGDWDALVAAAPSYGLLALVRVDDRGLRLVVADSASVVVETCDGPRSFAGPGATGGAERWVSAAVEAPDAVSLCVDGGAPGPGDAPYRTDGGAVPASFVTRRLRSPTSQSTDSIDPVDPFDAVFGPTVARTIEGAAVRPERDRRPGDAAVGVLVFSTGERVVVDTSVVIGRHPRSIDDATGRPARLVTVAHPEVSRRHAVVRPDRRRATIEDLGSLNGTTVRMPGHAAIALRSGWPFVLATSAVVELGGGMSFVVGRLA